MSKKGSVTIEAALVLPTVLMAFLVLLSFLQYLHMDYLITGAGTEAAIEFSYDGYLLNYLEITDLTAHYSYQYQSLKPKDFIDYQKSVAGIKKRGVQNLGEGWQAFQEVFFLSEEFLNKASKFPKEWKGAVKNEATVFVSRLIFDRYLQEKIAKKLQGYQEFERDRLQIKFSNYFFDGKASHFYISYRYDFPLKLSFMKSAEILIPIYIEGFSGNIARYQGAKYSQDAGEEEMVYITPKGRAYHTDVKCFTIYSDVKAIPTYMLRQGRKCEICLRRKRTFGDTVYKSDKSHIYHAVSDCVAIYKNVQSISRKEAENSGRTHCRNCLKKAGKQAEEKSRGEEMSGGNGN